METSKATITDNEIVKPKTKTISQSGLTAECWSIQVWGISACDDCEFLNTPDCGGERIRQLIADGKYPMNGLPNLGKE